MFLRKSRQAVPAIFREFEGVALVGAVVKCPQLFNCAHFTYCANKELLCRGSRRETADAQVCANRVALRKSVVLLAP